MATLCSHALARQTKSPTFFRGQCPHAANPTALCPWLARLVFEKEMAPNLAIQTKR
jgi:hypothetical protein